VDAEVGPSRYRVILGAHFPQKNMREQYGPSSRMNPRSWSIPAEGLCSPSSKHCSRRLKDILEIIIAESSRRRSWVRKWVSGQDERACVYMCLYVLHFCKGGRMKIELHPRSLPQICVPTLWPAWSAQDKIFPLNVNLVALYLWRKYDIPYSSGMYPTVISGRRSIKMRIRRKKCCTSSYIPPVSRSG